MNIIVANFKSNISPFQLGNSGSYNTWRDNKLKNYPQTLDEIIVEINDPRYLSNNEYQKLIQVCKKTNMVVYASSTGENTDPDIPLAIGEYLVGKKIDKNWLADSNGISTLTASKDTVRQQFIPYTNRCIQWHTDGYYNTPQQQIKALLLHAVHSAASGGENALLDPEIIYIQLREKNPDYIQALMAPKVMTIPTRIHHGKIIRPEVTGPVFNIDINGNLHMRFTNREHHVSWNTEPLTVEALEYLQQILSKPSPYVFQARLESGMGLVSNNVLHNRASYIDDEIATRLIYRARYYSRIKNTSIITN